MTDSADFPMEATGRTPATSVVADRTELRAAIASLWREELDGAEDHLRRALALDPNDGDARALLASTLLATGRPEAAMLEMEGALATAPGRFLVQMKAGEMARRLGDPVLAAERFLAALRLAEPGSRDAQAAQASRAAAQRAAGHSIDHQAVLPRWIGRLVGDRRVPAGRRTGVIDITG